VDPASVPSLLTIAEAEEDAFIKTRVLQTLVELDKEAALPLLRSCLRPSEEETVRLEAIQSLGKLGDKDALQALLPLVNDSNARVSAAALEVVPRLASSDDARVIEAVISATKSPHEEVRRRALITLPSLDVDKDELAEVVLRGLTDKSVAVRTTAASQLSLVEPEERAIPLLIRSLEGDSTSVRFAAARALGQLDPETVPAELLRDAVEGLKASLGSDYAPLRATALESLGKIGGSAAREDIERYLNPKFEQSSSVRTAAAEALAKIGDPRSLGALQAAVRDRSLAVSRAAESAIAALQVGRQEPVPGWAKMLEDERLSIRLRAVESLRTSGRVEAVDPLFESLLRSANPSEQKALISAISAIAQREEAARDLVNAALDDDNSSRRADAARVLGLAGGAASTSRLAQRLDQEPNDLVRSTIIRALGRIDNDESRQLLAGMFDRSRGHPQAAELQWPSLGAALSSQAELLAGKEDYRRAIEFSKKSFAIQDFGSAKERNWPAAASNATSLMDYYTANKQPAAAIDLAFRATASQAYTYWDDPFKATLSESLGRAYLNDREYLPAERHYLDALATSEGFYGKDAIQLGPILEGLAEVYDGMSDERRQRLAIGRAFEIRASHYQRMMYSWRTRGWLDASTYDAVDALIWEWNDSLRSKETRLSPEQTAVLEQLDRLSIESDADPAEVERLIDLVRQMPQTRRALRK
jgi:HEAT repeat protein